MSAALVPYRPVLRAHLVALRQEATGHTALLNARHFAWSYSERPHTTGSACWLAVDGGRALGMSLGLSSHWRVTDRRPAAVWILDETMACPPDRRSEVATALTTALLRGARPLQAVVGLWADATAASRLASVGFVPVGAWQLAFRTLPGSETAAKPAGGAPKAPFARLDAYAREPMMRGIRVQDEPMPDAMARLWARTVDARRLRRVHDETYYAWRYRNPLSEYRFVWVGQRHLQGFLVLQRTRGSTSGDVTVVEWRGRTNDDKALLLEAALALCDGSSLSLWSSAFSSDEKRVMSRLAFKILDDDRGSADDHARPLVLVRRERRRRSSAAWAWPLKSWDLQAVDVDAL